MKEGNIMQVGTPEEIYKKPENTFVAGFIGVSNFVECDVKEMTQIRQCWILRESVLLPVP